MLIDNGKASIGEKAIVCDKSSISEKIVILYMYTWLWYRAC